MKKNKMMRAASALMVAALLTTSVISGTFAKYVTTNSGSDSATVAKFGVTISINDDMGLFKTTYSKDDSTADSVNTVVSAFTDRKIAPGTKGSMSFKISGTPEVATKLTVEVSNTNTVKLDPGEYTLGEGVFAEKECKVTTTTTYEPIKWYFGDTSISEDTEYDKTLSELETALENLSKENGPNIDLSKTYYIGWKWDFNPSTVFSGTWNYNSNSDAPYTGAKVVDFLDTYLGNESPLQTEKFDIKITVTQID